MPRQARPARAKLTAAIGSTAIVIRTITVPLEIPIAAIAQLGASRLQRSFATLRIG